MLVLANKDYYPFGLDISSRRYNSSQDRYTYGFNGKERDPNIGLGIRYDYGFRIYDPDKGRFYSVDPLMKSYPMLTPYQFASNRPIDGVDLDGLEYTPYSMIQNNAKLRAEKMRIKRSGDIVAARQYQRDELIGGTIGSLMVVGGNFALNGLKWVSNNWVHLLYNPIVQNEIVATVYGFGTDEEWPIPAVGNKVSKTTRYVLSRSPDFLLSKQVGNLVIEEGAKFANKSEKFLVTKLLDEGKDVTVLNELASKGGSGRTPDLLVDGISTELKDISNLTGNDLVKSIKKKIEAGISQSTNLIIDIRNQKGASEDVVSNVLDRVAGNNKDKSLSIRVIGDGFEVNKNTKAVE